MVQVHNYLKKNVPHGRIILSVHDELDLSIPADTPNILSVIRHITNIIEDFGETNPIKLKIPIKSDFGIGYDWARASGKGID